MPNRQKYIRTLGVLLLAAVACTREPLDVSFALSGEPVPSDVPVAFAVGGQQTKGLAPITTLAALAEQDFSVSAWYSPEGETFDPEHAVKYIENHRFGYVTSDLAGETTFPNAWQGVAPHGPTGLVNANSVYWPVDGSLSFFCYAPYRTGDADIVLEEPVTDDGIAARLPDYLPGSPLIRVTPPETAANQFDFLASPALIDCRRDAPGAFPLDFSKHRMTQVEFWFAYKGSLQSDPSITQTFEQVRVSSIEIRNVVGSRYCYFSEAPDRTMGCAWSKDVSPADPADAAAELPKTTYRLVSATGGELKTGLDASLEDIEEGGDYRFINDTPTGHLFLLPQKLPADAQLVVNYAILNLYAGTRISEVVTLDLASSALKEWPEGKVVRYLLTLDLPERGVLGVKTQIIRWEDAGIPYYEQEMLY